MVLPDTGVVGCPLVRVLPVTQRENLLVAHAEKLGELFLLFEPPGDRGVVAGGAAEGGECQAPARLLRDLAEIQLRQDLVVELGGGDHDHALEVFSRRPEHRGPADVYLLYGLLLGGSTRHRLLERIEVYADEVYGANAVL